MSLKCGIVGLPNVGKSTIFRSLTNAKAEVANFPFCTIDPNQGSIIVPDERLNILSKMFNPKKTTPSTVEILDIAGLVKGASKGEGLGNKFLANIREVDAICHVVRCFDDGDIVHVTGKVDPVGDIETIITELALKDLEVVTNRFKKVEKLANHDSKSKSEFIVVEKVKKGLEDGLTVRQLGLGDSDLDMIKEMNLLTQKPVLYVANVSEEDLPDGGDYVRQVEEFAKNDGSSVVAISGRIEQELADLSDEERDEFLDSYGLKEPGKYKLIRNVFSLLGLITYFTAGEKEVRSWEIPDGFKAPQAAGVIHSDFERGFIAAEVVSFENIKSSGSFLDAKNSGLVKLEGKDYLVKDGDCCVFRFSV